MKRTNWTRVLAGLPEPITVVGVGNRLKGDDGAGPAVIDALRGRCGLALLDAGIAPENHIGVIAATNPASVVFVDAVAAHDPSGTIRVIRENELAGGGFFTHSLPLCLMMGLVRVQCSARVVVLGIVPLQTTFGAKLSPEVREAVRKIAAWFWQRAAQENTAVAPRACR